MCKSVICYSGLQLDFYLSAISCDQSSIQQGTPIALKMCKLQRARSVAVAVYHLMVLISLIIAH